MTTIRNMALAFAGLAVLAPRALAHTPYLLPSTFDVERDRVNVIGALTEDDYFKPDIPLNAPTFYVTTPSGRRIEVKSAATLKDMTVLDAPLEEAGTYRISTGQFAGRKQTLVNVGGKWLSVRQPRGPRPGGEGGEGGPARPQGDGRRPGGAASAQAGGPADGGPADGGPPNSIALADVPAGAPTMTTEGMMVVETYVSRGAPTEGVLKTTGEGFELKPASNPNAIYLDQGFSFQLLVDGRPAAGAPVSVYKDGNKYDDKRIAVELTSDAKGAGHVAFSQPGVYMLTTHYPVARPAPGEAPPAHSYVYSLTFEVTR